MAVSDAFPMYVGMNRIQAAREALDQCVPHVRGDEPNNSSLPLLPTPRSPCTWG